jgi:hypothetical protein
MQIRCKSYAEASLMVSSERSQAFGIRAIFSICESFIRSAVAAFDRIADVAVEIVAFAVAAVRCWLRSLRKRPV